MTLLDSPTLADGLTDESAERSGPFAGRAIVLSVVILAMAAVYSSWCGTPLSWDGAHQVLESLRYNKAFVYLFRFYSWPLYQPGLVLARFSDDPRLVAAGMGLPFILTPALSFLISWWVVKRHSPRLIFWAALGLAAVLPGQIFTSNDSAFQTHLFWPVFLGLLVPLTPLRAVVLLGLAIFQVSHPVGSALLGFGAASAVLLAWYDRPGRRRLLICAAVLIVLAGIGVYRALTIPDAEAQKEFTILQAWHRWQNAVAGWVLYGLVLMWMSGFLILKANRAQPRLRQRLHLGARIAILGAAACWIYWASDSALWKQAIDYRRWVMILAVPFLMLALAEALQARRVGGPAGLGMLPRVRLQLALVLIGIFAVVLSIQSTLWRGLLERLQATIDNTSGPVIARQDVRWIEETPLWHWAVNTQILMVQGKRPTKLLLEYEEDIANALGEPPEVEVARMGDYSVLSPAEAGPLGWCDFRPFVQSLSEEAQRVERGFRERQGEPAFGEKLRSALEASGVVGVDQLTDDEVIKRVTYRILCRQIDGDRVFISSQSYNSAVPR